jgi:hypothetical protein
MQCREDNGMEVQSGQKSVNTLVKKNKLQISLLLIEFIKIVLNNVFHVQGTSTTHRTDSVLHTDWHG